MRSGLRGLPGRGESRLLTLLAEAERSASDVAEDEVLPAIGRTVELETVLRARYAALVASPASIPAVPEAPRYLDTDGAATYLGISRSTVVRLAQAGTLLSLRPSPGTVRFDRIDLDAYMARRRGGAAPSVGT
jgi:excisionase family DNA binding protein